MRHRLTRPESVPESAIPYLSWRHAFVRSQTGEVVDPVLAIGWGSKVILVSVFQAGSRPPPLPPKPGRDTAPPPAEAAVSNAPLEVKGVQEWSLPDDSNVTTVQWVGEDVRVSLFL